MRSSSEGLRSSSEGLRSSSEGLRSSSEGHNPFKAPSVSKLWYPLPQVANPDTLSAGGTLDLNREVNPWEKAVGGVFNIYTGQYDYLSGLNALGSSAAAPTLIQPQPGFDWGYEALDKPYNHQGAYQSEEFFEFEISDLDQLIKFGYFPSAGHGISMVGLPEVPAPSGMQSAMKAAASLRWQQNLKPVERQTNNLPIGKIPYIRQVDRKSSMYSPMVR